MQTLWYGARKRNVDMITFIIPTTGRPSLQRTLASIECWPGDEILLVGDRVFVDDPHVRSVQCAKGNDWGHTERNVGMPHAQGRYLAHIDDDDIYVPGARALMADAIQQTPDRPVLFKMQAPNGVTLWQHKEIRCGNVGTPQILMPNQPTMFGRWESFIGGDCAFLQSCKWNAEDYVWREEVICFVGHNWG